MDFSRTSYPGLDIPVYRHSLENYDLDYIEGNETLFVTFFPADMDQRTQMPWGLKFLRQRGVSVLGVKYHRKDWYRGKDLHALLRSNPFATFTHRFEKTVFYGASKGGYAALSFSQIHPKPIVIAIAPQSTLDERIVPWEPRFIEGRAQDWDGDFRDASDAIQPSGRYYLCFDPTVQWDAAHARRIVGSNVMHLRLPFSGHLVPIALRNFGILKPFVTHCTSGTMTHAQWGQLARKRRSHYSYYLNAAKHSRTPQPLAEACTAKAHELTPDAPDVILHRGVVAGRRGDKKLAKQCFETILERNHTRHAEAAAKHLARLAE